jgi:hypothetical protein
LGASPVTLDSRAGRSFSRSRCCHHLPPGVVLSVEKIRINCLSRYLTLLEVHLTAAYPELCSVKPKEASFCCRLADDPLRPDIDIIVVVLVFGRRQHHSAFPEPSLIHILSQLHATNYHPSSFAVSFLLASVLLPLECLSVLTIDLQGLSPDPNPHSPLLLLL